MLDAGLGPQGSHGAGGNGGELAQPNLPPALKGNPPLVEPVDRGGDRTADLGGEPLLAMVAVTDGRPEGHVEAETLGVEQPALFLDPGADILAIGRVGADQAVPAPLAMEAAVDGPHPPLGVKVGRGRGRRSGCCTGPRRCRERGSGR